MTYSLDLRERVVSFVNSGGSRVEAARRYDVHYDTVRNWLRRDDLRPKAHGPRRRKLDKTALKQHVRDYPDARLIDRAAHFGVHVNAIWVALRAMNIVKKSA